MAKMKPLLIYDPEADSEAAVFDPMGIGGGPLVSATGKATGSQIAEVIAMCEGVEDKTSVGTLTPEYIKVHGKTVAGWGGGDWSGSMIPGAQCHPSDGKKQWNILHVVSYHWGYPAPPDYPEVAHFKGRASSQFFRSSGSAGVSPQASTPVVPPASLFGVSLTNKIQDLIEAWWDRDVDAKRQQLFEPVERDGAWMLYRNLPVNLPLGCSLGLDGKPLRASSLSLAVAAVEVRRRFALFPEPNVSVNSPYGTGQAALNRSGLVWRFEGFPAFGVVLSQESDASNHAITQAVFSGDRASPTNVFTNLARTLRIFVNSPRTQDWMNDGRLDLWVRVNGR
ncbi:MAG: hypothetical protein U0935_20265 [Pirellulales bacterium]